MFMFMSNNKAIIKRFRKIANDKSDIKNTRPDNYLYRIVLQHCYT